MNIQLKTGFAALGVLSLSLVGVLGDAAPADAGEADGQHVLHSDAMEDAEFWASASGESVDGISEMMAFQDQVNSILDPIILANPEIYSSSGFLDEGRAFVSFVDEVPSEVLDALSMYPDIEVRGGAALSEIESDVLNEALFNEIVESLPADGVATSRVSPETGQAVVTIADPNDAEQVAEVVDSLVDVPAGTPSARKYSGVTLDSVLDVLVEVDGSLAFSSEAVNGGDTMTYPGTNTLACTAGFPARNASGLAGLVTARHCDDALGTDGQNTLAGATSFMAMAHGDAQWHRALVPVNSRFRANWGSFHQITAHPVLKVGTGVCRFGAKTGRGTGCTTVKYVSSCVTVASGQWCGLAMSASHTGSTGGDSGGPWFSGSNAYGIHKGSGTRDGVSVNYFTSSLKAMSHMNLTPMYS